MRSSPIPRSLASLAALTLALITMVFLFSEPVMAQATTGSLRGSVVDPNGGVIAGATVTVKNEATGVEASSTTTTGDGIFVVTNLLPGKYSVTIAPTAGFSSKVTTGVDVRVADTTEIKVVLELGSPTETVTVTANTEEIVQTNSQISASFETRKVEELPSNAAGGGIDTLALLAPGVVPGFGNVNANGTTLSVNGNRARSNNFTIDGTDNNDLSIGGPSYFVDNQDLVQEFQIITNNYSAQYGRNQGAVINIVTKGGTNEFHGSIFEFHRNASALDAMDNLERRDPSRHQKDKFISNVYGGTIGGPIYFPRFGEGGRSVYSGKDRAFFFFSYQGIKQRESFTSRSGSLAILPEEFPRLAALFPGNPGVQAIINQSPFALTGLGSVRPRADRPTDTVTIGGQTFRAAFPERLFSLPFDQNEVSIRTDFNVTNKDNFYVRYLDQSGNFANSLGGSGGFTGDIPFTSLNLSGQYVRQMSSRTVNEFRATYQKLDVLFGGGCTDALAGCITDPADIANNFTQIQLTGIRGNATGISLQTIGPATNLPQGRVVEVYQFADNFTFSFGRHSMTGGVDFRILQNSVPFLPNINGVFRFNSAAQLVNNTPAFTILADGESTITYDERDQFYFFQDDWKVLDNFTLNLGIRYEYTGQPVNVLNELTVARETNPATAFYRQSLPIEARTVPRLPADRNNFAPRFGFAYSPRWGNGSFAKLLFGENEATVIRGGYSIAYDPAFYNILLNISTSAPSVFLDTITPGVALPANPLGSAVREAGSARLRRDEFDPRLLTQTEVATDFRSPYSQQFSFGIQRQVNRNNVFEVRYVGNRTVGLFQTVNRNPSYANLFNGFATAFTTSVDEDGNRLTSTTFNFPSFRNLLPQGTPAPQVCTNDPATSDIESACNGRLVAGRGLIRSRENTARSSYDSMQARYNGRFRNELTFGASYTFSKALDNASEIFSFGENAGSQNPFDINRGERSFSGFDRRHALSTNFLYDVPLFKDQQGFAGKLLGGFQINGTYVLASGRRYTPSQFTNFFFNSYQDTTYAATFFGFDMMRPFSGNPTADPRLVAISDIEAAAALFAFGADSLGRPIFVPSPTGFYSLNEFNTTGNAVPVTPNDVRLIINGPGAALRFGTPFGTAARNSLQGPRLNQLNLGVFKNTKIKERVTLQFRVEAFNVLNHPNAGYGVAAGSTLPDIFIEDAGISFADFGEVSLSSRRLQFGFRIVF